MTPEPAVEVARLVRRHAGSRRIPAAAAAVGSGPHRAVTAYVGCDRATAFDLASLTKPLITTPVTIMVLDDLEVGLRIPVASFAGTHDALDRWIRNHDPSITIEHLLTHTAGLAPGLQPQAARSDDAATTIARVSGVDADTRPPGQQVRYSDLGYVVVGWVVESLTGRSFEQSAAEHCRRIGASRVSPGGSLPPVAPTEALLDGDTIDGATHDEMAASLGGFAGHAGAFASLDDTVRLLEWWLDRIEQRPQLFEIVTQHMPGGRRSLGWVGRRDPYDFLPSRWSDTSLSHTGFTGTSVAFDPASGERIVLLTNAINRGRDRPGIRQMRQDLHQRTWSATFCENSTEDPSTEDS